MYNLISAAVIAGTVLVANLLSPPPEINPISLKVTTKSAIKEDFKPKLIQYPKISTTTPISGLASWYDYKLKDEPKYSEYTPTCASRDYARGTFLQVTRKDTGDAIVCRVNDFVENPKVILDLSSYAFEKLAPHYRGVIEVKVENIGCSCIKTARYLGVNLSSNTNAEDLQPNSIPAVGTLALFSYATTSHAALVTKVEALGFWVREGNFKKCEIDERFIYWIDPFYRGFWKNQ